ncbi:MAG TPA: D-alanyl-D-alanine carboxypeptidase/D-alanyl-D-alanine-endopeptidase [Pyrinomonadaceae bacterium]|jgi:D-alanyl-D-alanine carboxypeptidase/D-alanyl-D-alanine-endopeptidase (penicillin-binding protein 4)
MSIKKINVPTFVRALLLLSLTFGTLAPAARAAATPQQQQRQRRVNPSLPATTPTSAPSPSPTPTATPLSRALPRATPAPAFRPAPLASPTPSLNATPTATPFTASPQSATTTVAASPNSLEGLRARILEVMRQPELASSHVAVKVVSLDTGRTLFEENANKWMQPASNMKLYTVAAALDRLTPEFRFTTSVYAPARPDLAGTIRGDLTVYGRGDPTFATRFTGGTDYFKAIDEFASRIVAAGVRRVEGDIVGDESYFTGSPIAPGWEWDDLQWYYGAGASALTINDNAFDLFVKPGAREGASCIVTTGPSLPMEIPVYTLAPDTDAPPDVQLPQLQRMRILNRTTTAPRGTKRELSVYRAVGDSVVEVSGSLPLDDAGYSASLAVAHPASVFISMLRSSLQRQGVQITGRTRTIDARARAASPLEVSALVEIASRQSPPLSVIAAQTLKPSQNLYTELLLRALGKATPTVVADTPEATDVAGLRAVKSFLGSAGIDPQKVVMRDGSGLSRANLITPETTQQLLAFMSRHRYATIYRDAQPIAGIDGTLRNRMKGTLAAGNVRAKTGTLSTATSLSGYVTTAAGERLVFSLMINNPPADTNPRASFTDAIAVLLASFAGHS